MYTSSILTDIENVDKVYISAHTNPDGDAIGSCVALALALVKLGKKPIILLDSYNDKYNILSGNEYIYNADDYMAEDINIDVFFALDCGEINRLGSSKKLYDKAKIRYNIDHHISNNMFGDVNIVNSKASSTCEVVYEVISKIVDIDLDIATALYLGILTDTGGFRHNCTSKRTHEIAGNLVEMGVDTSLIHSKILLEYTLMELKVLGIVLSKMILDNGIIYTSLTKEEMSSIGATYNDIGHVVGFLINVKGAKVAFFASERDDSVIKLSFRSTTIDVNEVASIYGGGGHVLAAGGSKSGDIINISNEVLFELKSRLIKYEELKQ